jgi:hypothetical protein
VTEIRLAIRRLMSRRSATAVSVLTLASAIGAGAATWSLLSALLLNPLPVRDAKRLVVVGAVYNAAAEPERPLRFDHRLKMTSTRRPAETVAYRETRFARRLSITTDNSQHKC